MATDFIGTAHKIADEKMHIILEAKNLRERIKAFKQMLAEIPQADRENIRMILIADGHNSATLPALFNALDTGLGQAPEA